MQPPWGATGTKVEWHPDGTRPVRYSLLLRIQSPRSGRKLRIIRQSRAVVLEKVDMVSSHGVTQRLLGEENTCPPAYCITPSASSATTTSANDSRRGR